MNIDNIILSALKNPDINEKAINQILHCSKMPSLKKLSILNKFLLSRDHVLERAANYHLLEDPFFSTFMKLTYFRWSHKKLSNKDLYAICDYFFKDPPSSKYLINILINVCVDIDQIQKLHRYGFLFRQQFLFNAINRSFIFNDNTFYNKVQEELIEKSSIIKLELLKKHYSFDSSYKFYEIYSKFEHINERYYSEFLNKIPNFYDDIEDNRNYFYLRSDSDKRKKIYKKLILKLKTKKKFSLVRISDGETYAFTNDNKLNDRQEKHWWGETLDHSLREKIKKDFHHYLEYKPTMIGMPTPYMFVHYIAYKNNHGISIDRDLHTKVINRLAFIINYMKNEITTDKFKDCLLCENQVNNILFTKDTLFRLAKTASRTVIISGYKSDILKSKLSIKNLIIKEIPTHKLLTSREDTVVSDKTLPYVYQDVLKWIRETVRPGDLCLISGGFIGKMFILESAKMGAVALDIGQALRAVLDE